MDEMLDRWKEPYRSDRDAGSHPAGAIDLGLTESGGLEQGSAGFGTYGCCDTWEGCTNSLSQVCTAGSC